MAQISVPTAALLMNRSRQAVLKAIHEKKIAASVERSSGGGRGGAVYMIRLEDLPREAQLRYAAMQDETDNGQTNLVGYKEKFGPEGVDKLMSRLDAVREMALFEQRRQGSLVKKRAEVAALLGVSPRTLYSYEQAYKKEQLSGLMDATVRKDKGSPRTLCRMAQDFVHAQTCLSTRPQNRAIYNNLLTVSQKLGCDACQVCPYNEGSLYRAQLIQAGQHDLRDDRCEHEKEGLVVPRHYSTVDRFIGSIPESVKALGRYGTRYWEAKYMPKALRQKPETVNEVWFGDHHVFDVFVQGPDGRPVRPWLTAWMDARSGCMVGWALSLNPNSDTIVESLTRGIGRTAGSPFWGAPLMIYIDNGKDYRCKRIEGNGLRDYSVGQLNVSFNEENALLKTLGIGVTHAIPYRAWSKTIERAFGTIERRFIQGCLPGWCGNRSDARPEQLDKDIREGKLLTYQDFAAYFVNKVLPGYHALAGEDGLSPMDIYTSSQKAGGDASVSWAVLSMAKQNRESRRVGTTGIKFAGRIYNHPSLAEFIGEYVTILFNRKEAESISVMIGQDYVCEAYEADRLMLVGEDPEKLAQHMSRQQTSKRHARAALQLPQERIRVLHDLVMETPDLDTAATITTVVHERAFRERQDARKRAEKARGARTASERRAETAIREGLADRGMALYQQLAAEG